MLKDFDDIKFMPNRKPDIPEWLEKFAVSFYRALKKRPEKHQSPVDPLKLSKDYGESALPVRKFKAEEKKPSSVAKTNAFGDQLNMDLPPTTKVITRVNPQTRDAVDVDEDRRQLQSSEGRISSQSESLEKKAEKYEGKFKEGDIVVLNKDYEQISKAPHYGEPFKIIQVDPKVKPLNYQYWIKSLSVPGLYTVPIDEKFLEYASNETSNLMEE